MTWLGFCLQILARQQRVVLASVIHCPPPLQLPIGPIWACDHNREAGYLLPGRPETHLRQAARQLLTDSERSKELSIPLNPWAGGNTQKHNLRVHLRRLEGEDLSQIMLLDGKLRLGQGCKLNLESLVISDGKRQTAPLTAQAQKVKDHAVIFEPPHAHIAIFGAGALAHQVVKMLSDAPFTVYWEGNAAECVLSVQAANIVTSEPNTVNLPDNSHCLVMTHDHALDFELCTRLAQHKAVSSVGVVGSQRKCRALWQYLAEKSVEQHHLDKIRCPLGGRNTTNLNAAALDIVQEAYSLASLIKPH